MQSPVAAGLAMDGRQQQQPQQQWTMMQPPQPGMQPQNHEEVKTLWVGDLQYWVEESYLHNCFAHTGEVEHFSSQLAYWKAASFVQHVYCEEEEEEADNSHTKSLYELFILCNYLAAAISKHITKIIIPDTNEIGGALLQVQSVKIIRNKQTGYSEGYGFVEFISHASAEKVLQAYNGTLMPNTEQPFRLNWASFGIGERRPEAGTEHSIFVGDLAPDVTDYMLQEIFRTRYPSVKGAKVVTDVNTGRSKGYGFVRFGEEMERNRAMNEMNGVYCSSRPMRISAATPKKALGPAQQHYSNAIASSYHTTPAYSGAITPPHATLNDNDPNNTTIFVGGLDPAVGDEELKAVFGQFGELVYVKIPVGKGCGFVQFTHRASAEEALQRLHGTVIGSQSVRLSWGRSPTNKQTSQDSPAGWGQQDPNQWGGGGGYYGGYGQGYDQYGYPTQASHDAGAYGYGSYSGYGNYSHQAAAGVNTDLGVEHKEDEIFDPLAPPDIEKLNNAYIGVHEAPLLGRHLWLKTFEQGQATS